MFDNPIIQSVVVPIAVVIAVRLASGVWRPRNGGGDGGLGGAIDKSALWLGWVTSFWLVVGFAWTADRWPGAHTSLALALTSIGVLAFLMDWRPMGRMALGFLVALSVMALPLIFARRLTSSSIEQPLGLLVVVLLVSILLGFAPSPWTTQIDAGSRLDADSNPPARRMQIWLLARMMPLGVALAAGMLAPLVAFHSSLVAAQLLAALAVAVLATVAMGRRQSVREGLGTRHTGAFIWAALALMVAVDSALVWVVAALAVIPSGLAGIERWMSRAERVFVSRAFWAAVGLCIVGLGLAGLALGMMPTVTDSAYYN